MQKFFVFPIFVFLILGNPILVLASSVESDTSVGSDQFSEGVIYNGNTNTKERFDPTWLWNFGYTFSRTSQKDPTTNVNITDNTSTIDAGLGWKKRFQVGGGITYSSTPNESLYDWGPNFYLGYTYDLPSHSSTAALGFPPTFTFKLTSGIQRYVETFSKVARAKATTRIKGEKEAILNQYNLGGDLTLDPYDWFSSTVTYAHYFYSRNVTKFANTLDSQRAIKAGLSNFSSTLTSFPTDSTSIDFSFFYENWIFEPGALFSHSAVNKTWSESGKALLSYTFLKDWTVGLGYEIDFATNTHQNLALVNLAFNF